MFKMKQGIIFDWVGTLYEGGKGLFPFTERVLGQLKPKYKLGLITLAKQDIEARRKELERSGILGLFDSVIIDIDKTPKQYLKCMKEMETTPETTLIVDDRTVRGIKIGNQLGCKTYWIKKGDYAHEVPNEETGEPTHKINSIEDLLTILK